MGKREIPNLIKLQIPCEIEVYQNLRLNNISRNIRKGFPLAYHDFFEYCALLLYCVGTERFPNLLRTHAFLEGKVKSEVQFFLLILKRQNGDVLTKEESHFLYEELKKRMGERKAIVKKEAMRTGVSAKSLNLSFTDYRTLLKIIEDFHDITLINWFVPIVLTFERYVHICVKHIEETKFNLGNFKKRSFFDYKHTEIFTLVKILLKREAGDIKDHFLNVSVGHELHKPDLIKPYYRGIKGFPPIIYDSRKFRLIIDENGFIKQFFQVK